MALQLWNSFPAMDDDDLSKPKKLSSMNNNNNSYTYRVRGSTFGFASPANYFVLGNKIIHLGCPIVPQLLLWGLIVNAKKSINVININQISSPLSTYTPKTHTQRDFTFRAITKRG